MSALIADIFELPAEGPLVGLIVISVYPERWKSPEQIFIEYKFIDEVRFLDELRIYEEL